MAFFRRSLAPHARSPACRAVPRAHGESGHAVSERGVQAAVRDHLSRGSVFVRALEAPEEPIARRRPAFSWDARGRKQMS